MPRKKSTPKKRIPRKPKQVTSHKHKDKRVNIPTEELRDFVEQDEKKPKKVRYPGLLYARDPSLDPQLVWKGKDEQDQNPLEVPCVPVYIQEKLHPQAIIEQVKAEAKKEKPGQADLFANFNNIKFEEMVDFYRHEQNWSNRMILGDSLLVMTSLAEKEGLKGKVQMIYIDPPYGIKFGSNWQVSTRKRDVKDGKHGDVVRQPEQIKAYRDTWKYGIHSYLTYLRDRLTVARELLTETGSVFVQIGDENVHLVRSLMDEVFGSDNFGQLIPFRKKLMPLGATLIEGMCDYLLWFCKDKAKVKFRDVFKQLEPRYTSRWTNYETPDGVRHRLSAELAEDLSRLPAGSKVYRLVSQRAPSFSPESVFDFVFEGRRLRPPRGGCWVTPREKMQRLSCASRLECEGDNLSYVYYHEDFPLSKINNVWDDTSPATSKSFVVQTSTGVVGRCLLMTTDPGDLVLDPTCGSGTAAYVAEQWGRRWITIDTSRVALALARTRLMAAKFPYYLLSDSREGTEQEAQLTPTPMPPSPDQRFEHDIRRGFVYKRVPHVTLKSIANNEEIDTIHAKWQEKLEPVLAELNRKIATATASPRNDKRSAAPSPRAKRGGLPAGGMCEWEVPRECPDGWSAEAKKLHAEWWKLRRARQQEIDASIAKRADTELLFDQPYEDKKRIRVTGPFTVESLSPHRVLDDSRRDMTESSDHSDRVPSQDISSSDFVPMTIENLRKAGVKGTDKSQRLKFERLESYAGTWLHASGEYLEGGKSRRVAISIGPEHGTVGPDQVKEAAKEAVKGVGFDLLVVCGFAFDPHVSEEAKRYGKLNVMTARMNPDLAMGDELLKKTGAGNLFMVFGEPDLAPVDLKTGKLKPQKDGKYVVEVRGVDVYDPTTGEIRSSSTDDIACWFIDTDYNGESFFVRHAYFCGAQEPYDKLKRALRAEVDEAAWSALYSTKSVPFDKPKTGKVAIKVINHYGDEVLKVLEVR